jgi:hypothetical protein
MFFSSFGYSPSPSRQLSNGARIGGGPFSMVASGHESNNPPWRRPPCLLVQVIPFSPFLFDIAIKCNNKRLTCTLALLARPAPRATSKWGMPSWNSSNKSISSHHITQVARDVYNKAAEMLEHTALSEGRTWRCTTWPASASRLRAALESGRNKTVGHEKIRGRERICRETRCEEAACVLRRVIVSLLELEIVPRPE